MGLWLDPAYVRVATPVIVPLAKMRRSNHCKRTANLVRNERINAMVAKVDERIVTLDRYECAHGTHNPLLVGSSKQSSPQILTSPGGPDHREPIAASVRDRNQKNESKGCTERQEERQADASRRGLGFWTRGTAFWSR